jgi:hypothetical protein
MNVPDVSRFRSGDQLMDVRRGCRELDARREKKMCGVVCASLELRRWCHPCGEQPWRVERLSLLLLERLFRRARLNCQI